MIAQFGGGDIGEDIFFQKGGQAGEEQIIADIPAQGMDNGGAFVVGGGAIGEGFRHVRNGEVVVAVFGCGKVDHVQMIRLHGVLIGFVTIDGLGEQMFGEDCPSFIQPHFFGIAGGDQIAPPLMA